MVLVVLAVYTITNFITAAILYCDMNHFVACERVRMKPVKHYLLLLSYRPIATCYY